MIKIKWNIPIHSNIEEIDIQPVHHPNTYSYCHVPYTSTLQKGPITYTFHSFYSKDFIVFVMDSYHEKTQTTYQHKYMICIPTRYKLNEQNQYELDIVQDKPIQSYLFNNRLHYFKEAYDIKDWRTIHRCRFLTVYFTEKEKYPQNKLYKMIHSFIPTRQEETVEWEKLYYILILFMILKNIGL